MKKVSVIVPCYNQGIFLSDALDSVLSQTYDNWECIVVNDGSTDDTEKIVFEYISKYGDKFKYISQNNSGVVEAKNLGIAECDGEYILPLDADDKLNKEYINLAVPILDNHPNVKLVYCEAQYFGLNNNMFKSSDYSIEQLIVGNCIFNSSLFRKDDFIRVGGYNSNMKLGWEDWDLWLSLLGDGGDVVKINKVLFYIRAHGISRNTSIDKEKNDVLRRTIWENHKELYGTYYPDFLKSNDYRILNYKFEKISNSLEYKIGKLILYPIRKIQHLLK